MIRRIYRRILIKLGLIKTRPMNNEEKEAFKTIIDGFDDALLLSRRLKEHSDKLKEL